MGSINWEKWQEVSLLLAFSVCLLLLYITMPLVLQLSSATAVNISILSADFYSLIIGLYLFNFKVSAVLMPSSAKCWLAKYDSNRRLSEASSSERAHFLLGAL